MAAIDSTTIRSTEDSPVSPLTEQIADAYYRTTAGRSHQPSREYYESMADGLKLKVQQWLPAHKDARVLDLACGCGEFLFLAEKLGFTNTHGVDLCEDELKQARNHVRAALVKADVLTYLKGADTASFDFVSALNLLEHLSKNTLLSVLTECRRVLKPGGTLVAMVPNAVSPFGGLTRHWDITHEWAFTPNNFRQLAALIGFDPEIEFRECGPRVHGLVSGIRYGLWQALRATIAIWFLIEVGTTKDGIYSMDMLVRLGVPSK